MASPDLVKIQSDLISLAHEAGRMITSARPSHADSKKNSTDLVTETDKAVEALISTRLSTLYPTYVFLGEETYNYSDPSKSVLTDAPTFVVDPIDGTTNFVHGYPYVAVSLGLAIKKRPVLGVGFNPFTQELYTAITGQGAYVTSPIHGENIRLPFRGGPVTSPPPLGDLSSALMIIEWGNDRTGNDFEVKCNTFRKLSAAKHAGGGMVQGFRTFGSSELNLCAVAAGTCDAYLDITGPWAWDVCAGQVVLEEAGGRLVGSMPGDWNPEIDQRRFLAVRGGEGREALIEEIWSHVEGRVELGYDKATKQ